MLLAMVFSIAAESKQGHSAWRDRDIFPLLHISDFTLSFRHNATPSSERPPTVFPRCQWGSLFQDTRGKLHGSQQALTPCIYRAGCAEKPESQPHPYPRVSWLPDERAAVPLKPSSTVAPKSPVLASEPDGTPVPLKILSWEPIGPGWGWRLWRARQTKPLQSRSRWARCALHGHSPLPGPALSPIAHLPPPVTHFKFKKNTN